MPLRSASCFRRKDPYFPWYTAVKAAPSLDFAEDGLPICPEAARSDASMQRPAKTVQRPDHLHLAVAAMFTALLLVVGRAE